VHDPHLILRSACGNVVSFLRVIVVGVRAKWSISSTVYDCQEYNVSLIALKVRGNAAKHRTPCVLSLGKPFLKDGINKYRLFLTQETDDSESHTVVLGLF
jgi:hypothetical protein